MGKRTRYALQLHLFAITPSFLDLFFRSFDAHILPGPILQFQSSNCESARTREFKYVNAATHFVRTAILEPLTKRIFSIEARTMRACTLSFEKDQRATIANFLKV